MSQSLWILASWCVAGASAADSALELKPSICALAENQVLCEERVDIRWHSDYPDALCLFVDQSEQPLACWQDKDQGEFHYEARTEQSLTFQLRAERDDQLLASRLFEVIREYTEFRSRRRKPWNFF